MNRMILLSATAMVAWTPTAAMSQSADTPAKIGNWEVTKKVDGFSDVTRGISHTPIGGTNGVMVVKCDKPGAGSLYVTFLTPDFLGSDSASSRNRSHSAKFRLDDMPAQDLPNAYYDGKSASLISGKSPSAFLNSLVASNAKRIRVQFVTYNSNFSTIDVDISGVSEAVRTTAATCQDTDITG